jgi:phosphoglucomutase
VKYPNPEEASAMKLALELGEKEGADLVMGTDPDADRLGIAAPDNGVFRLITGNQLGVLLADYIFSSSKELGKMPSRPAFIKSIVTSELQSIIAESYGAASFDTLTGFKWIAGKIRDFETGPEKYDFVFGDEESYGFLVNKDVRDKDAVSAATMTAEMALYHKSQGRSLWDQLRKIWEKYGYFQETLISRVFKGEAGLRTMNSMMEKIRSNPPSTFAGQKVTVMKDYLDGTSFYTDENSKRKDIDLPSSNVIQLILADSTLSLPAHQEPSPR